MFVALHPEANSELDEQAFYYEVREPGLGQRFMEEVDAALAILLSQPRLGHPLGDGFHSYILDEFPFALIYKIKGEQLRVVAIAHNRRHPDYWRTRMAESASRYSASSTTTAVP